MKSIIDIMKKNKVIRSFYRLYKYPEFRELFFNYGESGKVFRFEKYGEENKDKCIYLIHEGHSGLGMFATLTWTLRRLEFADKFGFVPIVEWSKDSPVNVDNNENPFEIYFQPVSDVSLTSARHSAFLAKSTPFDVCYGSPNRSYTFDQEEIDRLSVIYKKYIKFQKPIKENVEDELLSLLGDRDSRILGIHVRGVDWRNKQIKGHPIAFTEEDYLQKARELFGKENYTKIFLASDSDSTIKMFKTEFGSKVVTYNALRTPEGGSSLAIFDNNNDAYRMGYEVIRDAYTLSKCDSLLCGLSYVSYMARIMKQSRDESFSKLVVLDKGRAKKGIKLEQSEKDQRNNVN